MANNPTDEPKPRDNEGKVTEEELRRLYPHYDANCKYLESRPFIFRHGPLKVIYTAVSDMFNGWRGQIKDPSSSTGWRKPSDSEQRQIYRQEEKQRRDKRK